MDTGSVAMVTGGASGIGRALCAELAERGVCVGVADVEAEQAEEVASEIRSSGGRALAFHVDVRSPEQMEGAVTALVSAEGRLDYLFLNAGVGVLGEVRDSTLEHWRHVLDINLLGAVHGTDAAYRLMVEQGSGHVIYTSSLAGLIPAPTGVPYAASKHALVALALSLRSEAAPFGVRVSVACPGFVRTGFGDAAHYLGVSREKIFKTEAPDEERVRTMARAILRGVRRNSAVITHPVWVRWAWWLYRLCPALFVRLVGSRIVKRHHEHRAR